MKLTELSDCEQMVMKCLWDTGTPMTVPELMERISNVYGKVYKETTIYTFLKRLREKGYVTSYKKGNSHFSPLVNEEDYLDRYAKRMSDFWGRTSCDIFLSSYCHHQQYSEAEWKEIPRLKP